MLREDLTVGSGEADGGSVAEKIVVSSLRSLGAEERGPVERTFLLLAVFPEAVPTIPMAVLDALVGLDEEESNHSRIRDMSGGQKVKVVMAACTWACPHLIILDEPPNYLDRASLGARATCSAPSSAAHLATASSSPQNSHETRKPGMASETSSSSSSPSSVLTM